MNSFTDARGRTWAICIDDAAVKRLRAEAGLDLQSPRLPARLAGEPPLVAMALWCLCCAQADAAGVSPEDFGAALEGAAFAAAEAALHAELAAACPPPPVAPHERARSAVQAFMRVRPSAAQAIRLGRLGADVTPQQILARMEAARRAPLPAGPR